ncbi:MAG TPA: ABC transporter substrate-binding protein [Limnochordia bacterium]|nr:ABC transporter substrate-binding protein [Limnochordia bacterium]
MVGLALAVILGAGTIQAAAKLTDVKVVLDWTPNTNHTGLYVARDLGYYADAGLDVQIIQPGAGGADQMVAVGAAQFGVGYQEGVTEARSQGVPLVSLAAVIQHNTSGFASPVGKGITRPRDFAGKTYGGWGSPEEGYVIQSLMEADDHHGGDFKSVKILNIGETDYFTAVKRDIDFAWIFYGWTGIEAQLRHEPLNIVYLTDYSKKLDYYTPIIETSEKLIASRPELVKAFMAATAKGYEYAIAHPDAAADILIKAVPDLDPALVRASQEWLSPRYQADAPQWGVQRQEVWQNYMDWLVEHKLMDHAIDVSAAYTNAFLPQP